MSYSITTKDGITINNIPDDVAPDSPDLKARVAAIRAGTAAPESAAPAVPAAAATPAMQSSQVASSAQAAKDREAIPILMKELEAAQVLKQAGDTRAAADVDAIVRELARKGVKVDANAIPAPAEMPAAPVAAATSAAPAAPAPASQPTGFMEGFFEGIAEQVTGAKRSASPEVAAALAEKRTIYDMPEANQMSFGLLKSALGGLMAGSEERAKIFAANFPGLTYRLDQQGTVFLRSPTDGKEYVIEPGLTVEDIPRVGATVAAFTPAGRAVTIPAAVTTAAATQGVIEASQATTGGRFDTGEVAVAGAIGPAGPILQRVVPPVVQAVKRGIQGRAPATPPAAAAAERPEPSFFRAPPEAPAGAAMPKAPPAAPAATAPAPTSTAGRGSAGAAATSEAVRRVTTAEGLPVPVTLTRGAAQRDAAQLAFEKEQMKGEFGAPLRNRAEENNLQILQNFDAFIDATGADAAFAGPSATGGSVVNALSSGYQAAKNKTRVAYTKAKNSPEAQADVDTNLVVTIGKGDQEVTDSLIGYINSKITGLPSSVVPDTARKLLIKMDLAAADDAGNLIAKPATVGKLEEFRKELSGTAKFDDNVGLREETILKKLVDAQTDPVSGPLYKEARSLRTKQANKYEDRAIVARLIKNRAGMKDPQVAVDQVFQRSILNGSPEEITFLKRVLLTSGKDGQQAFKELQAATAQHIRDQSTSGVGTDSAGRALVSPAKLNQIVSQLDKNGRLDVIFGKQEAARIRDLDEVVKYVTTVPPGTLINSSGTVGTLLAAIAETGAAGVTTGIPVPVVTGINQIIKWRKAGQTKAKINDALNALPIVKP